MCGGLSKWKNLPCLFFIKHNLTHARDSVILSNSNLVPAHVSASTITEQRWHIKKFMYCSWFTVYFLAVVNACNASLRSNKFSAMAVRTRKQYLTDLAENHVTTITLDQANTSGRVGTVKYSAGEKYTSKYHRFVHVAGILRNLGHKKKERTRQESTLLYTPGALTWKVSIILRNGKVCLGCVYIHTLLWCTWIFHPQKYY